MLINNKFLKYLSFFISIVFVINLIYMIYSSFFIVKNQFTDIGDTTYVNQVREDDYTIKLASYLTKNCNKDKLCEVQNLLAGLPTHDYPEFPFLGNNLYHRNEIEIFSPFQGLQVSTSVREESIIEVNHLQ